jgi:hypothetical protein
MPTLMFYLLLLFCGISLVAFVLGLVLTSGYYLAEAAFSSIRSLSSGDRMSQSEAQRVAELHGLGIDIRSELKQLSFDYLNKL